MWPVLMDPPRGLQKDFEVEVMGLADKSQDGPHHSRVQSAVSRITLWGEASGSAWVVSNLGAS